MNENSLIIMHLMLVSSSASSIDFSVSFFLLDMVRLELLFYNNFKINENGLLS